MVTHQTEVAVVGAGPAGLEAALAAAEAGAEVTVVDDYTQIGGQYFKQSPHPSENSTPTPAHAAEAAPLFERWQAANITHHSGTMVWGAFPAPDNGPDWLLTLHGPNAPHRLQAKTLILATGAYDRPIPFPGWTLPGVLTAGAAQSLLTTQGIVPGQRVILSGSGPLQAALASALLDAGVTIEGLLEAAPVGIGQGLRHMGTLWGQRERLREGWRYWQTLRQGGVTPRTGWAVIAAQGQAAVEAAIIAPLDEQWRPIPDRAETVTIDTIISGYGFRPATQVGQLLGCRHSYRPERGGWIPQRDERLQTSCAGVYAVGDGAGIGGAALARLEGQLAGLAAAGRLGYLSAAVVRRRLAELKPALAREQRFAALLGELFTPRPGLYTLATPDTIICRCEEVTLHEIQAAVNSGAQHVNEVKGVTRCGMGNCQGRICGGLLAAMIARTRRGAAVTPADVEAAGCFTVRAPLYPLPLAVLAEAAETV